MHYNWIEIPIKPYELRYQYDLFQSVVFITFQFVCYFDGLALGLVFPLPTLIDQNSLKIAFSYLYSICLQITRDYSVDWVQIYLSLLGKNFWGFRS